MSLVARPFNRSVLCFHFHFPPTVVDVATIAVAAAAVIAAAAVAAAAVIAVAAIAPVARREIRAPK